eukprot:jgi/Mesvir1/24189/Mv25239-RA.1
MLGNDWRPGCSGIFPKFFRDLLQNKRHVSYRVYASSQGRTRQRGGFCSPPCCLGGSRARMWTVT